MDGNIKDLKNLGVFFPLIYVTNTIISTSFGVMISREGLDFNSPIVWAFFGPLAIFFIAYFYVIIWKSWLLLGEDKRSKIEEDIIYKKGSRPRSTRSEASSFKPK